MSELMVHKLCGFLINIRELISQVRECIIGTQINHNQQDVELI